MRPLDGLLFDKDGTLFEFTATWAGWTDEVIDDLSQGDANRRARLVRAAGYNPETRRFLPHSPIIAQTVHEVAQALAAGLDGSQDGVPDGADVQMIEAVMEARAQTAPQVPAAPLKPLLSRLRDAGLRLGVVTNDSVAAAQTHLREAGVAQHFGVVTGFDSGHGGKPSPAPLLASARALGVTPERCAMVGDSRHDLTAGRAAGMVTIGVLTGGAEHDDLASLADVVLDDIGHLPAWLGLG